MRHPLTVLFIAALHIQLSTSQYVTLHDGSPIVGREILSAHDKLVTEFLGIPFAEPPVGRLRFRKPKEKLPWRKLLNATQRPNSCVQSLDTYFGDFFGATMWNSNVPRSEDCLYLNVYVPGRINPKANLPVLVWIYGGGFWSGCSTLDVYDAKIFASQENVILVAMNYRVSVFGFLYLGRKDAPGNMGLWDQLLSFKWVYKNIDVFGGNPDSITIFGESAGAASVALHLLSPRSQPYFNRAVAQSGGATSPWATVTQQVALKRAVVFYDKMNCANETMVNLDPSLWDFGKILECLVKADPQELRDYEWAPASEFVEFPWVPVMDGDFLPELPSAALELGNFKIKQLLAGSNLDEALFFIVYHLPDVFPRKQFFKKKDFITTREVWKQCALHLLPQDMIQSSLMVTAILHEYEPADLPIRPRDWINSLDKMLGDFHFTCSVNELALAHTFHGGETYYYYFTHRATQQTWPEWMGVLHGYEINFIFGEPLNDRLNYSEEEKELSERMMRYWANFARSGNPNLNPDGSYTLDVWPKYDSDTMEYMNLTIQSDYNRGSSRIGTGPRRKQCSFWKHYLPQLKAQVGDMREDLVRWKQSMYTWENEYMVDWRLQFQQYKRYQSYRYDEYDTGQC